MTKYAYDKASNQVVEKPENQFEAVTTLPEQTPSLRRVFEVYEECLADIRGSAR